MNYAVIDMSNLMTRLFYGAHGAGSWADRVGAALMGFRPNLTRLCDRFAPCHPVFVFDAPPYHRSAVDPDYKSGRVTEADDEKGEAVVTLKRATTRLGKEVLNAIGYTNVYARAGYEADDLCAAVRDGLAPGDRCVLASGDRDLYQLLDARCAVYDPQRDTFTTANSFRRDFGIEPRRWADVKALAGGKDGLTGCPGVAETTAVNYLRGGLGKHTAKYLAIREFVKRGDWAHNAELATIPYPGLTPIMPVPQPPASEIRWAEYYAAFRLPEPVDERRAARG